MLAWVDTETTGLDGASDLLLEVGIVLTDDELNFIDQKDIIVGHIPERRLLQMIPLVQTMHRESGLWHDVLQSRFDAPSAEAVMVAWLAERIAPDTPMCGSTISFDRERFLRPQMPSLEALFHYRTIDVSSFKETARRFAPSVYDEWQEIKSEIKAHRTLSDCYESIEEYKFYLSAMKNGAWQ